METMIDRQIKAAEDMKSSAMIVIDEARSHAVHLGRTMQALAHASMDTRPVSDLLDRLKETASKAEELLVQSCADSAFYQRYKEQHDQQMTDTEDEEE